MRLNRLAGLILAFLFVSFAAGRADAEVRTLKIYHLHTHEKAEIAFKKDGRYLPEGLKQLNYILRDWRRNEPTRMDPRLFDLIWAVYQKSGSHDYINVVCGYRAPETNAMLRSRSRGVAEKSQHMLGRALDFFIPGVPLEKLREIGLKMQVGGVGYYPTSGSPFVHMDVGSPRHWPRMSRRQLLALFPNGKTMYLPSDGKPLPGYEQALAAYKARRGSPPEVEVASASGRHRGFFATLFGGGSDEAEDNTDVQLASAKAAPAKRDMTRRAPAEALPGVAGSTEVADERPSARSRKDEDQQPETIVAALPARDVPLPDKAPRPEVDVGTAPDEEGAPADVALNVPLPSRRPDDAPTPPALIPNPATQVAEAAKRSGADQIAALLSKEGGRLDSEGDAVPTPPATLAAFNGPLPSVRPDPGDRSMTVAALPEARPDYGADAHVAAVPAVFTTDRSAAKEGRLTATKVSASPRLALLDRPEGSSVKAAIDSGVRTTPKEARDAVDDARPQPKSVAVPIPQEIVRWALNAPSFKQPITGKKMSALAFNIVRTPPRTVYTAGFKAGDPGEDSTRFSGKAVTFLSVAKFEGPDAEGD